MERWEKIRSACYKEYKAGDVIGNKEIIRAVKKYYPDVPKGSITPYDFCRNHRNKDPFSGKHHIFIKIGRGRYKLN